MLSSKDFPYPLNTVIEEDVEIPTFEPVVNEKKQRVEFRKTIRKVKQKTIYVDAKPTRIICAKDHQYLPVDKGRYLFGCIKCDWHKIAFPVTYKYDQDAKTLTHRTTGIKA